MFCSISGACVEEPVVCSKTGLIYEKRLIEKSLFETMDETTKEGRCPVTGILFKEEDLIRIQIPTHTPSIRNSKCTSIPNLLGTLQNEWDNLMLETCALKQELHTTKKELSTSLYQYDAACRVIARLLKEKKEQTEFITSIQNDVMKNSSKKIKGNHETLPVNQKMEGSLHSSIIEKITQASQELSQYRRTQRKISEEIKNKNLTVFQLRSSYSPHRSDHPGITSVDIHPENKNIILTGGNDRQGKILKMDTGEVMFTLQGHSRKISHVQFHNKNNSLSFTGSHDATVKIWNFDIDDEKSKPKMIHTLTGNADSITSFDLHPTGDYLLTSALDGTWIFYDIHTGTSYIQRQSEKFKGEQMNNLRIHPDGAIFGTAIGNSIEIWDIKEQKSIITFEEHTNTTTSVEFSENGYIMASSAKDGLVKLWDLRKLRVIDTIDTGNPVRSLHFDYSGTFLGIASGSRVCIGKDIGKKEWKIVQTFEDHQADVLSVKLSNGMDYLASTSMDRTVKIFSS